MKRQLTTTALALVLAATGVTGVSAADLRIGILESLSGPQTSTGRLFTNASRYVIDQINAQGGFGGTPIQVTSGAFDSQSRHAPTPVIATPPSVSPALPRAAAASVPTPSGSGSSARSGFTAIAGASHAPAVTGRPIRAASQAFVTG